jgi:hypothetical protein
MKKILSLLFKSPMEDTALRQWARVEYKHDAAWAYHEIVRTGSAPTMGVTK